MRSQRSQIAVTAAFAASLALAGCARLGGPSPAPANSPTGSTYTSTCKITGQGYTATITNSGQQVFDLGGFQVVFEANGSQVGSDTEPGSGNVNGINIINMDDPIAAGQSQTYSVTPGDGMPQGATSCQVVSATAAG